MMAEIDTTIVNVGARRSNLATINLKELTTNLCRFAPDWLYKRSTDGAITNPEIIKNISTPR